MQMSSSLERELAHMFVIVLSCVLLYCVSRARMHTRNLLVCHRSQSLVYDTLEHTHTQARILRSERAKYRQERLAAQLDKLTKGVIDDEQGETRT